MSTIYTPTGKAREYSPKALNIYLGCDHGCKYCYAPACRRQKPEEYFISPAPRKNLVKSLEKDLKKDAPKEQVLLSFIGDAYCNATDGNAATRACLELLLEYRVPVAILTKGGGRCLKDIDLFKRFGKRIQVGATLTFDNEQDSLRWEPNAACPRDRIETLKKLHDEGVRTFASFEPVIVPSQSLRLLDITSRIGCIDVYKIGKINYFMGIDKRIDWTDFLQKAVDMLRKRGKEFYVKKDLRDAAKEVVLYGDEKMQDKHLIK